MIKGTQLYPELMAATAPILSQWTVTTPHLHMVPDCTHYNSSFVLMQAVELPLCFHVCPIGSTANSGPLGVLLHIQIPPDVSVQMWCDSTPWPVGITVTVQPCWHVKVSLPRTRVGASCRTCHSCNRVCSSICQLSLG